MEEWKKLFVEGFDIKVTIGFISVFISWSFNGEYEALMAISALIVFDIITGTQVAIKNRQWSSRDSLRGAGKFFRYLTYMLVARMVDKVAPLPFASPLMDSFIAITEAGSILENFGKLGYPVPNILLNKLKTFNEKKS